MPELPISEAGVKAALDHIRKSESLDGSPLLALRSVVRAQLVLDPTGRTVSPAWALESLLRDTIRRRLAAKRGQRDGWIEPAAPEAHRDALAEDFRSGDAEREAWSCLYYRFVAPELLQVQQIGQCGGVSTRQVRRRITLTGVPLLAGALREIEAEAPPAGGVAGGRRAATAMPEGSTTATAMPEGPLSIDGVRAALDRIRKAEPLDDSPLLTLRSVVRAQLDLDPTGRTVSLAWALESLLRDTIRDRLAAKRGLGGDRLEPATPEAHLDALAEDFRTGDAEREAWSCLYYRFVAPELLQVQQIGRHGGLGARQVHRRINASGLPLLVGALRELEAETLAAAGVAEALRGGHNLGRALTPFVARTAVLARIREYLADRPLLTLVGPGGVGKTRIAEEVARAEIRARPDGVWFVDLGSLSDPAMAAPIVARTVRWLDPARIATAADLADALAGRETLIVLDNCEHLIAASAALAGAIVPACPGVQLLATSRRPLGIACEQVYPVPEMSLPPAEATLAPDDLMAYESVALFVDRAHARDAGFVLTASNAEDVAALCRRLDGLPLAIQLAAARVRELGVREIGRQLERSHRLLTHRDTLAPRSERHRSIEAVTEWSYRLLSKPERVLFARLAVFRGGWDVAAAGVVCAGGAVEGDAVSELTLVLIQHSLVHVAPADEGTRPRMLETVREFAEQRLRQAKEWRSTRVRHLAHYRDLAESAEPALRGDTQAEWLARLALEHDNLRVALDWALTGGSAGDGLRTASALWRFWYHAGFIAEGRVWLDRLLAAAGDDACRAHRAKGLYAVGTLGMYLGDIATARRQLAASVDLWRAEGEGLGLVHTLNNLAATYYSQGDFDHAVELYGEALDGSRRLGSSWTTANILSNLADIAESRGDLSGASDLQHESHALACALGDRNGMAQSLHRLGTYAHFRHDYAAAETLYRESVDLHLSLGDARSAALVETELGTVRNRRMRT